MVHSAALAEWDFSFSRLDPSSPYELRTAGLRELEVMLRQNFLATAYDFIGMGKEIEENYDSTATAIKLVNPPGVEQQLNINRPDITVLSRIRELGTYENGWNRPDSVAPSFTTVNDAEQFARALDLNSIHLPNIGAADDGEITFLWNLGDGFYMDLGFVGNGSYSYFARLPNGEEIIIDKAPIKLPLPEMIMACLRRSG